MISTLCIRTPWPKFNCKVLETLSQSFESWIIWIYPAKTCHHAADNRTVIPFVFVLCYFLVHFPWSFKGVLWLMVIYLTDLCLTVQYQTPQELMTVASLLACCPIMMSVYLVFACRWNCITSLHSLFLSLVWAWTRSFYLHPAVYCALANGYKETLPNTGGVPPRWSCIPSEERVGEGNNTACVSK